MNPMLHRLRERLERQIDSLVQRAVVNLINDKKKLQTFQVDVLADETEDDVEHFQGYGTSFHPPQGSEAIVFSLGGDRETMMALVAEKRSVRPTDVKEGEGGLYFMGEWKVFLADDGTVSLGGKEPTNSLARADRVEAELDKIKTALDAVSVGGGSEVTGENTYKDVGSVGADKVKGE